MMTRDTLMSIVVFGGMGLLLLAAWVFERGVATYQHRNDWMWRERREAEAEQRRSELEALEDVPPGMGEGT
jgi:hypothetical protein